MIRWVLGIEEISPRVFEYTSLFDTKGIPEDQRKESTAQISKKCPRNILLEDISDVLDRKIFKEKDLPISVQCYKWSPEERTWKQFSCLQWVVKLKE